MLQRIGSRWTDAVQRPRRERPSWPSPEGWAGVSHLKRFRGDLEPWGHKEKGQWSPMNKGRTKTGKVGKGQVVHGFVGHCMA